MDAVSFVLGVQVLRVFVPAWLEHALLVAVHPLCVGGSATARGTTPRFGLPHRERGCMKCMPSRSPLFRWSRVPSVRNQQPEESNSASGVVGFTSE